MAYTGFLLFIGLFVGLLLVKQDQPTRIDRIEFNTVVDAGGKVVLRQVIFWRWYPRYSAYHVTDWAFDKTCGNLQYYSPYWFVRVKGREYYSSDYLATLTTYDREVEDRKKWPVQFRDTENATR